MRVHSTPRNGVLLLSGYALRVAVERGHLVVEDGVGRNRRSGRFSRADRDLKRLVVLGHSGTISFDALRWLTDVGAAFAQIDNDGRVIAAAGPVGSQEPKLRRAQALAAGNGVGLAISKKLIRTKLERQRALAEKLPGGSAAHEAISEALVAAAEADTVDRLRLAEADGAQAYWSAWSPVEVRFVQREVSKVPERWRTFGRRRSPLTGGPRKAVNPANALLNYLYALVEAEARIAALAIGLDPALGVMHADLRSRDSLASDLMEPVRPLVDGWLLRLLDRTFFRKRDFFETRQGACRVMPPTTQALAETLPRWTSALAPVTEQVVKTLLAGDQGPQKPARRRTPSTPLTQTKRRAAHSKSRAPRPKRGSGRGAALGLGCEVCGSDGVPAGRRRCHDCLADHLDTAIKRANSELVRRRKRGDDPAHGGEATAKRVAKARANREAALAWEREHGQAADRDVFRRDVLSKLIGVRLQHLVRATGLSEPYCSLVRQGKRVPHPRHWHALAALTASPECRDSHSKDPTMHSPADHPTVRG